MEGSHEDSTAQDLALAAHSDGKRAASQDPGAMSQSAQEQAYLVAQAASLAEIKKRRKE
jgi:hypothetical protein